MSEIKQLNETELTDTTAIRQALDEAGVLFPRGARLDQLQEIYKQVLEGKYKTPQVLVDQAEHDEKKKQEKDDLLASVKQPAQGDETGSDTGDQADQELERGDKIVQGIKLLDPDNPEHWNEDGTTPKVYALESLLGIKISAQERDEAFQKFLNENSGD